MATEANTNKKSLKCCIDATLLCIKDARASNIHMHIDKASKREAGA